MKSCLIVYYSRTGVTDQAAHALAAACGADIEALQPLRSYRNAGGFLRAVWDAVRRIPRPSPPRNGIRPTIPSSCWAHQSGRAM